MEHLDQLKVAEDVVREFRKGELSILDWISLRAAGIMDLEGRDMNTQSLWTQLATYVNMIGNQLGDYGGLPVIDHNVKCSMAALVEYSWKSEFTDFCECFGWDFTGVDTYAITKICAVEAKGNCHIFCHICNIKLWLKEF